MRPIPCPLPLQTKVIPYAVVPDFCLHSFDGTGTPPVIQGISR